MNELITKYSQVRNTTWCDAVNEFRLTVENGDQFTYWCPGGTWHEVGKSLMFDMDWTSDSNYTIEERVGNNWHINYTQ